MNDLNLKQKTVSLRKRNKETVGHPVEAGDPVQLGVPDQPGNALQPVVPGQPVDVEERADMYDENNWDDFLI